MLDHVQRRALLEHPAREDALELILRIAHVELQEGTGQLLLFPRRCGLAGAQADDRIADAERLARLHRQVARDAVALVEQADDCDAFRHRRRTGSDAGHGLWHVDRDRLRLALPGLRLGRRIVAAGEQRGRAQRKRCDPTDRNVRSERIHGQSGVHAS
jgi:hypothetical protein